MRNDRWGLPGHKAFAFCLRVWNQLHEPVGARSLP
jgi:hypothetical protein